MKSKSMCLRSMIMSVALLSVSVDTTWPAQQQVQLETTTGSLHGVLDLPSSTSPWPVVVIVAGSGPTDRDGNQPQLKNDSLKLLGQALAAKGIAALRYDKRGVAQSKDAMTNERDLRFETYVADAVEWVAWLRRDSRFSRFGLVGHSEGSLVGILAAKQTKVDGCVSIAGPGRSAHVVMREQLAKLPAELRPKSDAFLAELVAGRTVPDVPKDLTIFYRPSVQPYLISWFKYDPAAEIARLEMPVLVLQGTTDLQVTVDDAKRLAAAKKDAKLHLIDGMNHVLKQATTPAEQQAGYTQASVPIKAELASEIAEFLSTIKK